MSGRPRSAAALANDQRKKNARNTLRQRGYRNMINGKSMAAALAKHRLTEKSNDEFFAALNASLAQGVGLATGAAAAAVAPAPAAAAAGNTTAKKPRTSGQLAYNKRAAEARAALEAAGLPKNSASVKRYLNGQMATGAAAAALSAVKEENGSAETLEEENASGAAAAVVPSVVAATPIKAKKAAMSHADAGKKAASSAKGSTWLEQIAAAKSNLNTSFAEVGLKKKATRANAMRLASTRRNNPVKARNIELNILSHAQGTAFNKNKKNATKRNKKNKNGTKRNNNALNRATRNFVNRRRNRLTRRPARNYGTMKETKRNTNSSYRPFKGNNNNNNFNIETLRNAPFNDA